MFFENKSSNLKIAIIDDGFDWHIVHKFRNVRAHFFELKNKKMLKQRGIWKIYLSSHGTRCFAIYANATKSLPKFDAYLIKIIDSNTRRASLSDLVYALSWCLENKIDIISISLGTTFYKDFKPIQNMIDLLVQNGTIIVAAHSNDNFISFPASAQNVIGVRCDYTGKLLKEGQYVLLNDKVGKIDIIGCCKFSGLDNILHDDEIENYNSYATPYIAALIHSFLIKNNNIRTKLLAFLDANQTIIKKFSFWEYIKPVICNNQNIDIPIIGVLSSSEDYLVSDFISTLCSYFLEDGYIASSISLTKPKNIFNFSYQYLQNLGIPSREEMVSFVSCYTQANLLFIQIVQNDTEYNFIDLILDETGYHLLPVPSLKFNINTPNTTYADIKNYFL